jgi:hypothetical protein
MCCLSNAAFRFIAGVIILAFSIHSNAQIVKQPISVNYTSLGAYSRNFSDIFSATINQASLVNLKANAFAVYGEKRFMLNDLNAFTTIVGATTSFGTFGFQADYAGAASFNESELGLMYARKLTEDIEVGAKFNYHAIKIAGYGSLSTINFETGAIFHLTEKLHCGVHIYNPGGSRLGKTESEKLASIYRFGVGYEASDKLFIGAEIIKQEDLPTGINASLQYNLHRRVFIRSGLSTANNVSYVCLGINTDFGRIDLNTSYHSQLGFSPGILLLFHLKKPEQE